MRPFARRTARTIFVGALYGLLLGTTLVSGREPQDNNDKRLQQALASSSSAMVPACYNWQRGTLRVVRRSTECHRDERYVELATTKWAGGGYVGPTGPTGAAGPMGPMGPKGETGAGGPQGPQGAAGSQGSQGVAGPAGPTGALGLQGSAGPAGPTGAEGLQGNAGPAGPTGAQGLQGNAGPAGPTGAQGLQGNAGPAGPTGAEGLQGNAGPAGPTGAQGLQGNAGPAGPTGAQGLQGNAGLAGPTGAQGLQGNVGPVGPTGAQGLAGATGAQGLQGLTGPPGLDGLPGAQGPPGPPGPAGIESYFSESNQSIGKQALIDIVNNGEDAVYFVSASAVVSNTAASTLLARCDLTQDTAIVASRPVSVPSGTVLNPATAHATLLQWVVVPSGAVSAVTVACENGAVPQFTAIVTAIRVGNPTIQ